MTAMQALPVRAIDESPLTKFHARLVTVVWGGLFIDGYIIGAIAIALPLVPKSYGLTPFWEGMLGASALIGLFVGGLVAGRLTDVVGRKTLYTIDLAVFLVGSVAQWFAVDAVQLFAIRVVMGVAIGADYAIGPVLLAEFMPKRRRGPLLGSLAIIWSVGYVVALAVCYLGQDAGSDAWRWMLCSSAIPAALILLIRIGLPESPRWLARRGRVDEARQVCREHLGHEMAESDLTDETPRNAPYHELFSRRWRARTVFAGTFWFARAWPNLAIYTFLPAVLVGLGISDENLGTLAITSFWLVGGLVGIAVINRIGRRRLLLSTLTLMAGVLVVLGIVPAPPPLAAIALFALFSVVLSAGGVLEFTYPAELFPTELRASGAGTAAACSRIGATAGTFLLPILIDATTVRGAMLITAGVCVVGLVVSAMLAPETSGKGLAAAAEGRSA